jgi:hypothetical protein
MEFVPLLVIAATIKKVVDFVAYAKAGDTNAIVKQVLAWLAGIGLVVLTAHTPWAAQWMLENVALAKVGGAGQILVGIAVGSAASAVLVDVPGMLDPTRSTAPPKLLD